MPTILTHTAVPLATGLALGRQVIPRRLMFLGMVAAMLPDLDGLAFKLGIAYADAFGHRGATHSLAFAILLGLLAYAVAERLRLARPTAALFIFLATLSHPLLDMLTNGGLGVALWWPVSTQRLFAPWQVIEVSPIALRRVFSARGWAVLQSELLWVWLPATAIGLAGWMLRQACRKKQSSPEAMS